MQNNFQLSILNGCSQRYEKMNNSTLRIKHSQLSSEFYLNKYGVKNK